MFPYFFLCNLIRPLMRGFHSLQTRERIGCWTFPLRAKLEIPWRKVLQVENYLRGSSSNTLSVPHLSLVLVYLSPLGGNTCVNNGDSWLSLGFACGPQSLRSLVILFPSTPRELSNHTWLAPNLPSPWEAAIAILPFASFHPSRTFLF